MAYNSLGLEDPQNWPFSVRYTRSPYRKSKFPLGPPIGGIQPRHPSTTPSFQGMEHEVGQNFLDQRNVEGPPSSNGRMGPEVFVAEDEPEEESCHQQERFNGILHSEFRHHHHNHYGLPITPGGQLNSNRGDLFHHHPSQYRHHHPNIPNGDIAANLQVEGLLDEGYIEELKQSPMVHPDHSPHNFLANGGSKMEFDPYSYVYDSKGDELSFHPPNLLGRAVNKEENGNVCDPRLHPEIQLRHLPSYPPESPQRNGGFLPHANTSPVSANNNGLPLSSCENEYEEIRDVARYMNGSIGPPRHFKSFSSTDDILAEVVQVQQRHDRVLDQLNLEVENLLIRSSNEVESNGYQNTGIYSRLGGKMSLLQQEGVEGSSSQPCYCNVNPPAGKHSQHQSEQKVFSPCNECGPGGTTSPYICSCERRTSATGHSNGHGDSPSGGNLSTVGRKKKLDRLGPSNVFAQETLFNSSKGPFERPTKPRHHRSHSLIPHWKIREHLKRLPFLRQNNDKWKKGEGYGHSTCPITSSDFPKVSTEGTPEFLLKSNNKNITNLHMMTTASTAVNPKNRSSSMDELRATEEHYWYTADSDTEPDSLTPIPPISSPALTEGKNCNNTLLHENGTSRLLEIGNSLPDVPKAPKFRRGSGLKDKWRESWSHSKTLSKTVNMEDENRLLRWFSLRKSQGSLDSSSGMNRHSTLPLLSEEEIKRISYLEDEEGYWPRRQVQPPCLPPPPPDLSPELLTRRHIVAAITHSENSYVAALQRLVNEYKKPLECSHPAMLSHSKIATIFHRVPEILQCHSLFRIALADSVRSWDVKQTIGEVFVASFSKSLVLDVYSEFINNFGMAMDTAKAETRRKSAFAEFLKVKQMTAHDRLSLFGLMVKPVQRFPQFILLLQDLLKHTPKDHHDRMSLQLALTQLETLAAMLNERKRESEQYQAFRETIKSIGGGKFVLQRSIADDPNRILLRQDIVTNLEFDNGSVSKSKTRKLLLLNDMLICVSPSQSTNVQENHYKVEGTLAKVEKSAFKWSASVRDVDVEDISISPTMSRFVHQKSKSVSSNTGISTGGEEGLNLLEEMQSLMHDYEVLSRILGLVSSLKTTYEGLTESSVKELMGEIQYQIRCRDEEISYFDSSCLTLIVGNNKEKHVFQMASPAARNEWIEELRLAQLALDPNNSPAWDIPAESPYPIHKLPLFVRALPLSKSPHLTMVKCGCYFTHTSVSPTGRSKTLDYLWVTCTDGMSSHVTSFKSHENILKEVASFDLVEEKVNDLLFVSPYVWMGTESRKIMVYDPADIEKESIGSFLLTDSVLKLALFGGFIYAGLADGNLAIFSQTQEPKNIRPDLVLKLGSDRVPAVFGSKEHVYAACGNAVVTINSKTNEIERSVVLTHHDGPIAHMACSGVSLWIATAESGTVWLYHLESMQHLYDVSIAPSVFRTVRDSFRRQKGCFVTSLTSSKGLLWIGTNLGVVLTIGLPRLEGVPIISSGKSNVSYHGYSGPVTFILPLSKPTQSVHKPTYKEPPNKPTKVLQDNLPNGTSINSSVVEEVRKTPKVNFESSSPVEKSVDCLSNGSSSSSSCNLVDPTIPSDPPKSPPEFNGLTGPNPKLLMEKVILRKKNSRENFMRNCKTLPRQGNNLQGNLRFSIDSDVYGLYGNLINVRGLEDEGRFVDPLYDALRRSDPELVALDAKISTLDRRVRMRMSRPRSLDLSNWSVDSKISASSDESVGTGRNSNSSGNLGNQEQQQLIPKSSQAESSEEKNHNSGTTKKNARAQKKSNGKGTVIVVVGGRGYANMRLQNQSNQIQDHFAVMSESSESKICPYLTLWQMKT